MAATAFLADHVVEAGRKLYANGAGWNVIRVPTLPAALPPFGIGILIHVPYHLTNQPHTLEITLVDLDGRQIPLTNASGAEPAETITATFNIGRPPNLEPGEEQIVPMAINMFGLEIADLGFYKFVLTVDNEPVDQLRFKVEQPQ